MSKPFHQLNVDDRMTAMHQLAALGWRLSTYAASIHWDGSPNERDWLTGLQECIEAYQGMYAGLFGEQPGMKIDAAALPVERTTILFSEGQVNTFHKGLALQAIAKYAEKTNTPADAFMWIDKPVTGCWYDFYDLATQKYGQCRLGPDGWAQEPRGLFPALMGLRGE